MIDTDKYTGHTKGPWRVENGSIHAEADWWSGAGDMIFFSKRHGQDANSQLVADAPLLLEEVKRLLEENTYLNHMLDGVDKHTLDHVAEQAQIKMHEAGECYDFCIVCETEGDEQ